MSSKLLLPIIWYSNLHNILRDLQQVTPTEQSAKQANMIISNHEFRALSHLFCKLNLNELYCYKAFYIFKNIN